MTSKFTAAAVVAAVVTLAAAFAPAGAWAQAGLSPGERAGNTYVPSTHTPGCGGIMCDADDPRRAPGAPPPPPCQGLVCGLSPYGMERPVTAAEAQRMNEERARAAAAAAAAAVPPPKAARHARRHAKVVRAKKAVAARTPDPSPAAPAPAPER